MMLRIGFLECDHLDQPHVGIDGDYDALFERLFVGSEIELVRYGAARGELPRSPHDCDGWLVPGSRHSVFDDVGWIGDLGRFTGRVIDAGKPVIGVCFGHQLIAQVLGAPVARAERGWGVGAIEYRLRQTPPGESGGESDRFTIIASHRDQVLELPDGTTLLADAAACPVAAFVGDSVLAIQAHPEFTPGLAASLLSSRVDAIGPEPVAAALESLEGRLDSARVAAWMTAFVTEQMS